MDVSKLMDVKAKMIELENNGDVDMINLKMFLMYEVRGQCTAVAIILIMQFCLDPTHSSIFEGVP